MNGARGGGGEGEGVWWGGGEGWSGGEEGRECVALNHCNPPPRARLAQHLTLHLREM